MNPDEYGYAVQEPGDPAAFSSGVGGSLSGEFHVDGTPMRLATFVIAGIILLVVFNRTGFRFHVVG